MSTYDIFIGPATGKEHQFYAEVGIRRAPLSGDPVYPALGPQFPVSQR